MQQCNKRADKWAEMVMARIKSVHDLPAGDAVYHQICSSNFRTGKDIPLVAKQSMLWVMQMCLLFKQQLKQH